MNPRSGDVQHIAIKAAGGTVTDLYASDDAVWVTSKEQGRVFCVDPEKKAVVASIPTGLGAHDLAVDGTACG